MFSLRKSAKIAQKMPETVNTTVTPQLAAAFEQLREDLERLTLI
jgi:hypothetical protein